MGGCEIVEIECVTERVYGFLDDYVEQRSCGQLGTVIP